MSAADANELRALRAIAAEARDVLAHPIEHPGDEYLVEREKLDALRSALAALVQVCRHCPHPIGRDQYACCKCGADLDAEGNPTPREK